MEKVMIPDGVISKANEAFTGTIVVALNVSRRANIIANLKSIEVNGEKEYEYKGTFEVKVE